MRRRLQANNGDPSAPQTSEDNRLRVTTPQLVYKICIALVLSSGIIGISFLYLPYSESTLARSDELSTVKKSVSDQPNDICGASVIFNPQGFKSKTVNFKIFRDSLKKQHLPLAVLELAFQEHNADTPSFTLSETDAELVVHRSTSSSNVLWQKERLLNEIISEISTTWPWCTKIVWCDADIVFSNPDWVRETSKALDSYSVVQPFSDVLRLSKSQTTFLNQTEIVETVVEQFVKQAPLGAKEEGARNQGIAKIVADKGYSSDTLNEPHVHGYTGFAWAARLDTIQGCKLFDYAIVGGGDTLFAHALWGHFRRRPYISSHGVHYKPYYYKRQFPLALRDLENLYVTWASKVHGIVNNRVGYVGGTAVHLWHGSKENRQYSTRFKVLEKHRFDPLQDIQVEVKSGSWVWSSHKDQLHDAVARYFSSRSEDGDE